MITILKFSITPKSSQLVEMPYGSIPIRVGWNPYEKEAHIWAECDIRKPKFKYQVNIVGAGESLDQVTGRYIGTITYPSHVESRMFDWHVYFNSEPLPREEGKTQ